MNSDTKVSFARKSSLWCRKRTNIEQRLLCSTGIGCLIIIILLIIIGITLDRASSNGLVCTTPSCIHEASTVLKYMDSSTKPCDDFYQFACGGYLKTTSIPEDKSGMGSFQQTIDIVLQQLKTMVQQPVDPNSPKQYHLFSKIYNLCMNLTSIEEDGLKTIKIILRELGGWPLLEGDRWNEGLFDWRRSVYMHRKIGFDSSYFISLYVGTDFKNSSRRMITLDQPPLGLSREFLIKGLDEKYVKAYYEFSVDIAVIFGANRDAATREMRETLDFEISLAKITLPKEDRRNSTALYNPMTIEELRYNYPSINWLEYITNVLDVPDIDVGYDEVIDVCTPLVLRNVLELLKRTPKRVQANYIMKTIVYSSLAFLNEEVRKRHFEYYKVIVGTTERKARWKECTSMATGYIHLAAGAMYVRKYFDLEAKKSAENMVNRIRAELVKILNEIDWMDGETRTNALEKAGAIVPHIGFPIELLDDKKVEKFYSNLELDTDNYVKSMMQLELFLVDYYNKQLRKPINKTEWIEHSYPMAVNVLYAPNENSIGVFFNKDRPHYMNYGAIGSIIGHEITHGFDDQGRQYDKDGNLNEWWNEDTKNAFIKKAACIIEHYGNYTVPELDSNINGISTQGENIADNGGMKEAYLAYQSWVKENGVEPNLPGLDYTPNQLFWISAAHLWCSKTRKESLKLSVTVGYHSPERFRVIGTFSNMEHFSKDFNCPVGSRMNPEYKCKVW